MSKTKNQAWILILERLERKIIFQNYSKMYNRRQEKKMSGRHMNTQTHIYSSKPPIENSLGNWFLLVRVTHVDLLGME